MPPPLRIVLPQLDAGVRALAVARVHQAGRPHGPEGERVGTAPRHLLDRHAALEVDAALEVPRGHLLGTSHGSHEAVVLLPIERAVDVVFATLPVARRL